MFNLKYNLISFIGVIVGVLNTLFIYLNFGASYISDVYFIGISIFVTIGLLLSSFSEIYLISIRKCKHSRKQSSYLFSAFFNWAIVLGLIFTSLSFLLKYKIVTLFVSSDSLVLLSSIGSFFCIMLLAILIYSPLQISIMSLSAFDKIGWSNFITIIPNIGVLISSTYILISHDYEINYLAIGYVSGMILSLLLSLIKLKGNVDICVKNFNLKKVIPIVKNSLKLRMAHNIHNVFLNWAFSHYLTLYGPGTTSLFFYTKKMADVILNVVYIPSYKILTNRIIDLYKNNCNGEILFVLKKTICIFPLLYGTIYIIIYGSLPFLSKLFSSYPFDTNFVLHTLFFLMIANSLITIETAYGIINQIRADYIIVTVSNIGFILIFYVAYIVAEPRVGALSVAIAVASGQISNFFFNRKRAINVLCRK